MKPVHAAALVVVLAFTSCAEPPPPLPAPPSNPLNGTVVDLSHEYSDSAIFWPTAESFRLEKVADGVTPQGYYYAANRFMCAEHGGTHIDAPRHFSADGQTVDQLPLERLMGAAVCVDVSQKCAADPDYQASVEDFQAWELFNGDSLDDKIVLIYTGYDKTVGIEVAAPADIEPADPTGQWAYAATRRLRDERKIPKGAKQADVARLLEKEAPKPATAGGLGRALKASYLENQLKPWGIWPLGSLK